MHAYARAAHEACLHAQYNSEHTRIALPALHGHAQNGLTVLPHINAKDGLTARILGANHKRVVLIGRGLNGKRAVLGNRQPGPACMQMSQLSIQPRLNNLSLSQP